MTSPRLLAELAFEPIKIVVTNKQAAINEYLRIEALPFCNFGEWCLDLFRWSIPRGAGKLPPDTDAQISYESPATLSLS